MGLLIGRSIVLDIGILWPLASTEEDRPGLWSVVSLPAADISGSQAPTLSTQKHSSDSIPLRCQCCHRKLTCSRSGQLSRLPLWVPTPCRPHVELPIACSNPLTSHPCFCRKPLNLERRLFANIIILIRRGRKTGQEIPEEENRDLIADRRTPKAVAATRS